MVSAGDFRNGVTFDMDGNVYQIIEFQHVKPGKGAAFVRTKIRNVITGAVTERTFNPSDKYPPISRERIWNICIPMATCTISWIRRPTRISRSTRAFSAITSSSSRRTPSARSFPTRAACSA